MSRLRVLKPPVAMYSCLVASCLNYHSLSVTSDIEFRQLLTLPRFIYVAHCGGKSVSVLRRNSDNSLTHEQVSNLESVKILT